MNNFPRSPRTRRSAARDSACVAASSVRTTHAPNGVPRPERRRQIVLGSQPRTRRLAPSVVRACVRPHTSRRAAGRCRSKPGDRTPGSSVPASAPAAMRTATAGRGVLGASEDGSNGVAAGERAPITLSRASCNGDYLGPTAARATQQRPLLLLLLPLPLLLMCTTDFHSRSSSDATGRRSSDAAECVTLSGTAERVDRRPDGRPLQDAEDDMSGQSSLPARPPRRLLRD